MAQPGAVIARTVRAQHLALSRCTMPKAGVGYPRGGAQRYVAPLTVTSFRQQLSVRPQPTSERAFSTSAYKAAATPPSKPVQEARVEEQTQEEEGPDPDQPPPKASLKDRLKFLTKRYGWWALGVYLAASTVDLSLTYAAVHMLGADHIKALEAQIRAKIGMEPRKDDVEETKESSTPSQIPSPTKSRIASSVGDGNFWTELVLAYTIHKTLLLPLRVAFTAAVTPSFVKWLVKIGWARANHQVRAQVAAKAAQKAAAKSAGH